MGVMVDAKSAFAKLDAYVIKAEERLQEGLNYGAEEYLAIASPPRDLGNLEDSSWVISSKNPIGLPHAKPFVPARKERDDARLADGFVIGSLSGDAEASLSKMPMTILTYTAFYANSHGKEWYKAPIDMAASKTAAQVGHLTKGIK